MSTEISDHSDRLASSDAVAAPQREREPWISLLLYRLFKWGCVIPVFRFYFRGRVHRPQQFFERGPLIVVANHASDVDPPFVGATFGRPVAFMAKEELFRVPGLGKFITLYGAYPVRRGAVDRRALRAAAERLRDGWAVGLFLDGTRTPDGRIHNPRLGAAFLAAQTQSTIIPVSVWGTDKIAKDGSALPQPVPVTIRIGEPIAPPASTARADLETVTERCVQAVHALHDLGR
ncbi:MAG: lysophospholipid acyltransferase family protein [Prochlorotrichaceae cyanobacterium]